MDDKDNEPSGVPPVGKEARTAPVERKPATEEQPTAEPAPAEEPGAQKSPDDLESIDVESGMNQQRPQRDFTPPKPKRSLKKPLIILVIIIIVALLGLGAANILKKKKPAATKAPDNSQRDVVPAVKVPTEEKATLKTYKNDTIKIQLSYPSNWTVKELTDEVVFSSPSSSYTKKDGSSAKGPFRLQIQKGINQLDTSTINGSVAVKISQLIPYTAPADGQRKETYLSYLGKTVDAFSFMLISSGKQYNPGDKVSGTLPLGQDSFIIAGGYGTRADENLGFDTIAVDKIDQSSAYTQAVDMIKSLKLL